MASRKGRKSWAGEIPVETLNALKEESKQSDLPMWKIVDQALRMYLGLDEGSTEAALERKLEELDDKLEEYEQKVETIQSEREELREQKQLVAEQLEEIREKKASYKEKLDEILEDMVEHPNQTVMAYMSEIKDAATDEYGQPTKDNISRVIADLKDRRDERDLEIPDHRFKRTAASVSSNQPAAADGGQSQPDLKFLSESADESGGENE